MASIALLVDKGAGAQDLAGTNRTLVMADDLLTEPVKRGNNIPIPYVEGELRTDKKTDAKTISVTYRLEGNDSTGTWIAGSELSYLLAEYAALRVLLPDPRTTDDLSVTLTSRIIYPAPTGSVDTTAAAEYLHTTFAKNPDTPRQAFVTVEFRLTDGYFS